MRFVMNLVCSRMRREKKRLAFILLAIAASSCLVVWTIGGFQALFIDETTQEANYLGVYDVRVSPAGATEGARGGGSFVSPASRRYYESDAPSAAQSAPSEKPDAPRGNADASSRGRRSGGDSQPRRGGRGRAAIPAIPESLLHELADDPRVALCDEVSALRTFVCAPGTESAILEDDDAEDEGERPSFKRTLDIDDELLGDVPEGVAPELHRRAFAAYRATMGTPMGLGSLFMATTAKEAPFELQDGRWFRRSEDGDPPAEAVLTVSGAKTFKAKVGDPLVLISVSSLVGTTSEYQLEVVGIVDDPELNGFYISDALGRKIASGANLPFAVNSLWIKLRGDAAAKKEFCDEERARLAESTPTLEAVTREDLVNRAKDAFKQEQSFKYQAASGTLLASLAALLIVFTALNTSVDEQRRLIAFYRVAGLTRSQVAISILIEGAILAIPGWLAGMIAGWTLVLTVSGKPTGLNLQTSGFSFLCTVVGAIVAALAPMIRAARVRPLEALGVGVVNVPYRVMRRRQTRRMIVAALVGFALILGDATLIRFSTIDTMKRAAIHSGFGVLALALGVVALAPLMIRMTEFILIPITAKLLRFDSKLLRRELSGNAGRVAAVAVALSVGGGLFVTMQIWGRSMLEPFLPGRRVPDAFAAFLPGGLRPEIVEELKALPMVDPERFVPVAVEQAAFAEGSVTYSPMKSQFANVVFFGVDVAKAFEGETPLVGMRFRQGSPEDAFAAMKSGRGVVVTDSLPVDYGLNLGDTLKVAHPRDPERVLEYPIVGVVAFDGWQWLSKTGGVRRNFGRSGGLVFAREGVIANDFEIERRSYFWFDQPGGAPVDYDATEAACDRLARKNLRLDQAQLRSEGTSNAAQTAYVKLSTRESLTDSIVRRADKVIWGLSRTPLTTLAIASIAVVGAIAGSVRARRWQFGVMRAMGMTRGAIVRMIIAEGVMIGVVASCTSFLFGFLAAQGALKLGRSMFGSLDPPLVTPFQELMIGLALTLTLCVAAALYPAFRTGSTEPLTLLQSGRSPD